jgi:hypothetical protein
MKRTPPKAEGTVDSRCSLPNLLSKTGERRGGVRSACFLVEHPCEMSFFSIRFILETAFTQNLIQHDLDVMRSVPIAVVVETASFLQDASQLHAAGPHEIDVRFCGFVTVLEGTLFFRFAPEHLIVAIRVERWINVDQVNAGVGKFSQLIEAVAAIDDPSIEQGGRAFTHSRWGCISSHSTKSLLGTVLRYWRYVTVHSRESSEGNPVDIEGV